MFLGVPKSNLMLALDVENASQAYSVLDQCADLIDNIKFNYPLVLKEGLQIISDVKKKYKLPILADFKVADVPVTNNRIVKLAIDAGVDAIMVHGFIGCDAISEIMDVAAGNIGVVIVTELTNPGGLEFTRRHSHQFAEMCKLLDCCGIQAPGNRPDRIKELRGIVGPEKVVVSCGIGAQGGSLHEAVAAGASFGIVGRSIYSSDNPREATLKILECN